MYIRFMIKRKITACRLLASAFGVLLAVAFLAGWRDPQATSSVRLYLQESPDGGLYLCADPPLQEVGSGGALALGLTLSVSEGGSWGEITTAEGAEGMTLTVGKLSSDGRIVKILLDGSPTGDACRLFRLEVAPHDVGVRFAETDGVYCLDPLGNIKKIPLTAEDFTPRKGEETTVGIRDEEAPPPPPMQESPPEHAWESSDNGSGGEVTTSSPEPETAVPPPPLFVGCQETPVADGVFAVRFLFWGEALGETPVICLRGGGGLQAENQLISEEVSEKKGEFSACTFRGLQEDGVYTFLVYTREGVVEVRYHGGQFLGFEPRSRHP